MTQMVAWLPGGNKVLGSNPTQCFLVRGLDVIPLCAQDSPGYSGVPTQHKVRHVRLIGDSKLPLGVRVWVSDHVLFVWAP